MKTKTHPKLTDKKWMPTLVWILCIVAIWEIMACVVATTKRTPENILPHIYQILYSLISTKKVTGTQTALQVVALASVQTLLRAAVGFLIGMVAGFGLGASDEAFRNCRKTCISVSDVDSVDSDFGHGTDHPFSDRKHWRQPDRYRSDLTFIRWRPIHWLV